MDGSRIKPQPSAKDAEPRANGSLDARMLIAKLASLHREQGMKLEKQGRTSESLDHALKAASLFEEIGRDSEADSSRKHVIGRLADMHSGVASLIEGMGRTFEAAQEREEAAMAYDKLGMPETAKALRKHDIAMLGRAAEQLKAEGKIYEYAEHMRAVATILDLGGYKRMAASAAREAAAVCVQRAAEIEEIVFNSPKLEELSSAFRKAAESGALETEDTELIITVQEAGNLRIMAAQLLEDVDERNEGAHAIITGASKYELEPRIFPVTEHMYEQAIAGIRRRDRSDEQEGRDRYSIGQYL